jgi:hypothetical protein
VVVSARGGMIGGSGGGGSSDGVMAPSLARFSRMINDVIMRENRKNGVTAVENGEALVPIIQAFRDEDSIWSNVTVKSFSTALLHWRIF